ncbi:hypothetical protein Tco_0179822 [Tanacetum coccineum]
MILYGSILLLRKVFGESVISKTPKKKSPVEQYIFQRHSSAPTEPSSHDESSLLYAKLGLTDSEMESDEEVLLVIKSRAQDKGQARPNPGEILKLTVEEHVILEEPASSTGTLSSLQHLTKDFRFGDQFFNDKPFDAENEKTTAETEAESMVFVTIHQDTSAIPPMTSQVIDFISRTNYPNEYRPLPATVTVTATTTTTITTLPLPPQPQQSTTNSILIKRIGELEQHMADLVHSSDDDDIKNDHIPKVNLKQDWWKPLPKEDRPAIPEPVWSIPSSDLLVPINNWASALASTYAPPPENSLHA